VVSTDSQLNFSGGALQIFVSRISSNFSHLFTTHYKQTNKDGQINTAIAQMEAMANNPSQLKMTADQMKQMSESELSRAVNSDNMAGGLAAAPSSTATTGTNPLNISKSQFQQATEQLNSMTP